MNNRLIGRLMLVFAIVLVMIAPAPFSTAQQPSGRPDNVYTPKGETTLDPTDVYVVESGDNLWTLSPRMWRDVMKVPENKYLASRVSMHDGKYFVLIHPGEQIFGLRALGINMPGSGTVFGDPFSALPKIAPPVPVETFEGSVWEKFLTALVWFFQILKWGALLFLLGILMYWLISSMRSRHKDRRDPLKNQRVRSVNRPWFADHLARFQHWWNNTTPGPRYHASVEEAQRNYSSLPRVSSTRAAVAGPPQYYEPLNYGNVWDRITRYLDSRYGRDSYHIMRVARSRVVSGQVITEYEGSAFTRTTIGPRDPAIQSYTVDFRLKDGYEGSHSFNAICGNVMHGAPSMGTVYTTMIDEEVPQPATQASGEQQSTEAPMSNTDDAVVVTARKGGLITVNAGRREIAFRKLATDNTNPQVDFVYNNEDELLGISVNGANKAVTVNAAGEIMLCTANELLSKPTSPQVAQPIKVAARRGQVL
jgi:hypothetical protein